MKKIGLLLHSLYRIHAIFDWFILLLFSMCHAKLGENFAARERIKAPSYVLDWIKNGVNVPLTDENITFDLANHKLSVVQEYFVDIIIKRLLRHGYIEHCSYKPRCVSPLGCVPKTNSKFRF
jgi:hypothetical protein